SAMRMFPFIPALQLHACLTLFHLCAAAVVRTQVVSGGGMELVIAAQRAHAKYAPVQVCVCGYVACFKLRARACVCVCVCVCVCG
ncbi:MAG: hypothetical protein P4M14_03645, partial [Gammaproteobacteria bacterium]|nr:hypothetical protein [Gammaproteobacteria bacterium]